ncbi:MAG: hypothetical protein SGPRY_008698, partial [Prymnesium sp.]
ARRLASRAELEAQAASEQPLSKSLQKRILKLHSLEALKQKRKDDKKQRRRIRKMAGASSVEIPPIPDLPSPAPGSSELSLDAHTKAAWEAWCALGSPRLVLAPMVNQSELAFRLLARR